jgi:predicted P-loop ATPase
MRIFECIKDISTMNKILIQKGDKISSEDGIYKIESSDKLISLSFSLEEILNNQDFIEVDQYKKNIIELPANDDDIVKNYRIQLDVKTSKKKLIEIENILQETLRNIL